MTLPRTLLLVVVALTAASRGGAAQDPAPDLAARLGKAVDAWERDLGSIVADETYAQSVVRLPRSGTVRESNRPPREDRRLRSELTLVHFDGPSDWIGFRHVVSVDGRMPRGRPSPAQVLDDPTVSWDERWRRALDLSASFNIGSIARDVNLPTFPFAVLRSANHARFRFATPRAETIGAERLHVLSFRERGRPTLVAGLRGRDVPLEGQVWFTPDLHVRRTEILLRDRTVPLAEDAGTAREEDLVSRITVTFGPNAHVGASVPLEMRERYDNSWGETTTGQATYTNFRRFRTSGRLVRPSGSGAAARWLTARGQASRR